MITLRNRLDNRLAALKEANKKTFVSFMTAGYPNEATYLEIMKKLPQAGVDIIEIGVPFSDPMTDGPAIQAANLHALKEGVTLAKILDMVRTFREEDNETPVILMGYYNPFYSYGIMRLIDESAKAGVDGFIIPDLPPEEDAEFRLPAKDKDLHLIRMITPTTDAQRLPTVLKDALGMLYCLSISGITGSTSGKASVIKDYVTRIRQSTELPISIGFGISTTEQVHDMAEVADGVIVGSAILKHIGARLKTGETPGQAMIDDVLAFVAELGKAAHAI